MRSNSEADYWSQFEEATPDQLEQFEQSRLRKREERSDVSQFQEATEADLEAWRAQASPEEVAQLNQRIKHAQGRPTTIREDIRASLESAPSAIGGALKQLPMEALRSISQATLHPVRALENVGAGVLEGAKGAVNLPSYIAEYLGEKDIPVFRDIEPYAKKLRIGETGLQKLVLGEDQSGDALLRGIGEFAPYARIGAASKGLTGLAKRGAAGAAFGAGQQQDPLHAAILSLAGEGAVKGVKSLPKLRPSRAIKSPLTPEELQESLRITEGTQTGLGEVIQNPTLQRAYQNVLSKTPFSGATQTMQRTAKKVTEKGHQLMDELGGSADHDVSIGQQMTDALKEAESQVLAKSSGNFEKTADYADKLGVEVGRGNFSKVAAATLEDSIKKSAELSRELPRELLEDLKFYSNPSMKNSLNLTNIFRGKVGEKASKSFKEGDAYQSGIYSRMKDALDKDIKAAVDAKGDSKLKSLYDTSMDFYKEHVVPFKAKEIRSFTRKGADPDVIASKFIRTSSLSDQSNLIKKLQSKLPADKKNLLGLEYFSRAVDDGVLNPVKMKSLYNKLGERQRKALIPDAALRKKIKDYSTLVHKNKDALNLMFNPPTGQRNLELLSHLGSGALGAAGSVFSGSLPIGVAAAGVPSLLGRAATKYLTSPKVRAKVVGKMIKQKKTPSRSDQGVLRDAVRTLLESSNPSN